MKHINKILLSVLVCNPLLTTGCSVLSQGNSVHNEELLLYAECGYVEVGSSLQILVSSSKLPLENYRWSVDYPTNDIYITPNGILFVSKNLAINDPFTVKVMCVNKNDESSTGSIGINVVPTNIDSNFFGFEDGVIHTYDPFMNPTTIKVIRDTKEKNTYKLERPIDLKVLESRDPTSWVTFNPIFRKKSSKMMRWNYTKPESSGKTLVWFDYENDSDTDVFPQFDIISPHLLKDKFVIYFLCDGVEEEENMPKLIVDYNIWTNKNTPVIFSYDPPKQDLHSLKLQENDGAYSMQNFCPAIPGNYDYSNTISGLYCFRNLHEYSDFNFEFEINPTLPEEIKKSFSYNLLFNKFYRAFDNFPIYKITFWYSFNMRIMPSAKDVDYRSEKIGRLKVIDGEYQSSDGYVDFFIEWI